MNKSKANNYSNLLNNIQKEQQEIKRKDYTKIDKALSERYQGQQASTTTSYIRQSISVTKKEVQVGKQLQRQLATEGEVVNKSQLYRAALAALQKLKTAEIIQLLGKFT